MARRGDGIYQRVRTWWLDWLGACIEQMLGEMWARASRGRSGRA